MSVGVMKDYKLKLACYESRIHWVDRGTGTPEDKGGWLWIDEGKAKIRSLLWIDKARAKDKRCKEVSVW
jgi:hypothetical protein